MILTPVGLLLCIAQVHAVMFGEHAVSTQLLPVLDRLSTPCSSVEQVERHTDALQHSMSQVLFSEDGGHSPGARMMHRLESEVRIIRGRVFE